MQQRDPVTIIGAGLAGSLLAILLARQGYRVRVYERLPDLRRETIPAGRSINLALAARGIRALEIAGVMQEVLPLLIPMRGRLLHDADGKLAFLQYGQREHEVIHSVSRPGLNRVLLDAAERAGVELAFGQSALASHLERGVVTMREERSHRLHELPLQRLVAADGAGSVLRRSLAAETGIRCSEDLLEHGYKELTLAAEDGGRHRIEKNALHIWPRGGFMLIALPNVDGSFTATLFLPQQGAESFAALSDAHSIEDFFRRHFPDACELMPNLAQDFREHPTGVMGTVRCERWHVTDRLLLIGDAAHAMTPFHGQGMNCAFEDCRELSELLAQHADWAQAFAAFEQVRRPNTDAISEMALENYLEMRDTVRDPKFQLQKALSLELERRFADRFVPRYSMVMFHDAIPYTLAFERGRIQNDILAELTRDAASLSEVDFDAAARLIAQRLPVIE
jgi:kynurenine 3-monooxygenase